MLYDSALLHDGQRKAVVQQSTFHLCSQQLLCPSAAGTFYLGYFKVSIAKHFMTFRTHLVTSGLMTACQYRAAVV